MGKKRKSSQSSPNKGIQIKRTSMATSFQSPCNPCGPNVQGTYQSPNGQYQISSPNFATPQGNLNFQSPQQFSYVQALNSGSPGMQNMQQPLPLNQSSMNTVTSDQFFTLIQRLDSIDSRLVQLDSIKSAVDKITVRLDNVDQKVIALDKQFTELERSRQFDSSNMEQIMKKQTEIDSMLVKMKALEQQQTDQERTIKSDITDLKCRNMRDNLLFFGIPEVKGEKDTDCTDKVLDLIETQLEIQNAKAEIKLHRAHRIGRFIQTKTRPIVAKFAYYPDREKVRLNANKLERPYGISQQFPAEVMATRRSLVPVMLEARKQGREAYIKVDKLYIQGQLYRGEDTYMA